MQKPKSWKAEEVIGLVPNELLDNLASETGVDYSIKKLHGKSIFKLFLFAFLTGGGIPLTRQPRTMALAESRGFFN